MLEALDQDNEFRDMVSAGLDTDQPDRASWLFLTRPEGWDDELALMGEAATEQSEASDSASRLKAVEKRLEATTSALASVRDELSGAEARIAGLESQLSKAKGALDPLRGELDEARRSLADAEAERSRIVKNLKAAEELSTTRLETLRVLEAEVTTLRSAQQAAQGPGGPKADDQPSTASTRIDETPKAREKSGDTDQRVDPPGSSIDTESLASSLSQATAALGLLVEAFESATKAVSGDQDRPGDPRGRAAAMERPDVSISGSVAGAGDRSSTARRSGLTNRRSLIRLTRGVLEGTPEGILQILRVPEVAVFVDGYNVAMEAWPHLSKASQRDSLMRSAASASARTGAEIHLVFDGVGDGSRPNVSTALPVRVHFSDEDTEADDLILTLLDSDPARPALVVSSDKRVISGALQRGANSVTSAQMLAFVNSRDI